MRFRWPLAVVFILLFCSLSASAVRRNDLPTSGGGVLNDCGSGQFVGLFLSHNGLNSSGEPNPIAPVLSLTPITLKDSSGNVYTAHVDLYDWGTLVGCPHSDPSAPPYSEGGPTHSLFVISVVGSDGSTKLPVLLSSFEIARPLTNPDFNVCQGGWQQCNTGTSSNGDFSSVLFEPAAAPGADESNTVWSFGTAHDLTAGTAIPLNSNQVQSNQGVSYGSAVLIADGTVTCASPAAGCNSIVASTPYRLTFIPSGSSTPVTLSSLAAGPTPVSAKGHDTSPIVITGGTFAAVYDVSGNFPTQTNGLPTNGDGTSGSTVTFSCSSSTLQQYRSIYFQYTAPVTTQVYVTTANSHYDTVLSVTGGSVQSCNDDTDPSSIGVATSALSFQAVAGTQYQILVTEYPPSPTPDGGIYYPATSPDIYVAPLSGDSTLYFTLTTPQLIATPATAANFGAVTLGSTSTAQTVNLKASTANFGSTGITNVAASATGDFHVTPASCATPLADSSSCALSVTFTPTASGARTGTLTVTSGGADPAENTPITIALAGTGGSGPANVTTTGGTNGMVPLFTGASTVVNSLLQQYNGGIGIGRPPAATLDVNGKSIFRGGQIISRSGDATASTGYNSSPVVIQASVYNSKYNANLLPYFQLQTEPVANNTASVGATLNFLYYSGIGAYPAESGLYINGNGIIHFAPGQTFPTAAAANPASNPSAASSIAGPKGDTGPIGPAGTAGPDIAVSGAINAGRGFFSRSADSSVVAFSGSNTGSNATVMSLDASTQGGYGLIARSAYIGLEATGESHAGQFDGNTATSGDVDRSGSSFKIDNPIDPENKYLSHSSVESPERLNLYNGIAITDATGTARIAMPSYYESLNRDFRYQLTVIGQFSKVVVASGISNGVFTIRTEKPNVRVSWQVTGVRQDAWANAHNIPVEEDKTGTVVEHFVRPEHLSQPEDTDGDKGKLPPTQRAPN